MTTARGTGTARRGQGVAEYALILALVALLVIAGLALLGAYYGSSVAPATPVPSAAPGPSFVPPSPAG
ncbi:MAG: hypothetical protein ACP5VP_02275 [Candidatus Limnocylindrales bacterium]